MHRFVGRRAAEPGPSSFSDVHGTSRFSVHFLFLHTLHQTRPVPLFIPSVFCTVRCVTPYHSNPSRISNVFLWIVFFCTVYMQEEQNCIGTAPLCSVHQQSKISFRICSPAYWPIGISLVRISEQENDTDGWAEQEQHCSCASWPHNMSNTIFCSVTAYPCASVALHIGRVGANVALEHWSGSWAG